MTGLGKIHISSLRVHHTAQVLRLILLYERHKGPKVQVLNAAVWVHAYVKRANRVMLYI